ncbi:MAG: rhomboid family intramembrane serine protease [Bacteroidota bacterium]|nr:rhomboid family intramembrane serine protease [Bacteroidota bacterium]
MNNFRTSFAGTPAVVKNLIILNILFFLATYVMQASFGLDITKYLALYLPSSEHFRPYQFISHMFMHGSLSHIFFNMFALWMFGRVLESVWGGKRFFIFYFVTGIGAALIYSLVNYIEFSVLKAQMSPDQIDSVLREGYNAFEQGKNFVDPLMRKMNLFLNTPTIGASGAVFGVLLGFGMLFPNTQLMLLFPPIPIKAKYFVIFYGVLELFLALSQPGSNIAHVAHLGGMIFGYILIKYWGKQSNTFY